MIFYALILAYKYNYGVPSIYIIQYWSDPALYQNKLQLNPGFTFGIYFWFTLGLLFENVGSLGVYFGFTRGLLWINLEIAFEVICTHWSVKQIRHLS